MGHLLGRVLGSTDVEVKQESNIVQREKVSYNAAPPLPKKDLRQPNGEFWSWVASWSCPELGQGGHAVEPVSSGH